VFSSEINTLLIECIVTALSLIYHLKESRGRITGTVLAIIFHLLQFLYYSERDTRQSYKLANTSAEVFDGF